MTLVLANKHLGQEQESTRPHGSLTGASYICKFSCSPMKSCLWKAYGPACEHPPALYAFWSEHEDRIRKLHCQILLSCRKYSGRLPRNTNDVSGCLPPLGRKREDRHQGQERTHFDSSLLTSDHPTSLQSVSEMTATCINDWQARSMIYNWLSLSADWDYLP